MYPSGILQGVLTFLSPQIRNLLLTIHSLACTIKHPDMFPGPDLTNVDLFLADNLDAAEPKKIELLEYDPMGALYGLCELMADVGGLVQDYAAVIYSRACYHDGCAAVSPFFLSSVELRRITRAIYRLKLFGMLFYNDLRRSAVSSPSPFKTFFDRLSTFELDELITAYQFVFRDRRYVKFVDVLRICTCSRLRLWRSEDLWNHLSYCELYTESSGFKCLLRPPRSSETFWYTLIGECFSSQRGPWAQPAYSRPGPIKRWGDLLEADEPSEGWLRWSTIRNDATLIVNRDSYVSYFQELGYCFWDAERLESWDNLFTTSWFLEEQSKSLQHTR
jgi:hypothetical protein